jgi:hypothetical protein
MGCPDRARIAAREFRFAPSKLSRRNAAAIVGAQVDWWHESVVVRTCRLKRASDITLFHFMDHDRALMPPEVLAHATGAFQSTTDPGRETGFGLAIIIATIVETHVDTARHLDSCRS